LDRPSLEIKTDQHSGRRRGFAPRTTAPTHRAGRYRKNLPFEKPF